MTADTEALRAQFEAWYTDGYPRAAEHQRQISPRGWRAQRAELMMRAKGGP